MVSIIVPIYNVEEYLKRCIDSLVNQTYKDIEIILVNDGSTDSSLNICKEYANQHKIIKLIDKMNGGLSSARNAGLKHCQGEYIAFVDSDDWVEPNYIEVLLDVLEKHNVDIAQCSYVKEVGQVNSSKIINQYNEEILTGKDAIKKLYIKDDYVKTVVAWNKLYRRNIFERIRFPEGLNYEDEAIIHEILYKAGTLVKIDYTLYHYLIRKNSITQSEFSLKRLDAVKAFERRIDFFTKNKEIELLNMTIPRYFRCLLGIATSLYYSNIENKHIYIDELKCKIEDIKNQLSANIYMSCTTKLLWLIYNINFNLSIKINRYINNLKSFREKI